MLAEAMLNEALAARDVTLLNSSGDFAPEWPEYRWESEVAQRNAGLYDVSVRVIWVAQGVEQWVTFATLMYPSASSSTFLSGPWSSKGS